MRRFADDEWDVEVTDRLDAPGESLRLLSLLDAVTKTMLGSWCKLILWEGSIWTLQSR